MTLGEAVGLEDSAEAIRRRMAELRQELTSDVNEVSRGARELASPMYYVRRFPWAVVAGAAAVGYMLIPKRRHAVTPDAEMLAELVRKNQVKVETAKASSESQGLARSLLVMGLTWGLRTGLNYLGQRMTSAVNNAHEDSRAPRPTPSSATQSDDAAASIEEPWRTPR